jgi:hypothetical protein
MQESEYFLGAFQPAVKSSGTTTAPTTRNGNRLMKPKDWAVYSQKFARLDVSNPAQVQKALWSEKSVENRIKFVDFVLTQREMQAQSAKTPRMFQFVSSSMNSLLNFGKIPSDTHLKSVESQISTKPHVQLSWVNSPKDQSTPASGRKKRMTLFVPKTPRVDKLEQFQKNKAEEFAFANDRYKDKINLIMPGGGGAATTGDDGLQKGRRRAHAQLSYKELNILQERIKEFRKEKEMKMKAQKGLKYFVSTMARHDVVQTVGEDIKHFMETEHDSHEAGCLTARSRIIAEVDQEVTRRLRLDRKSEAFALKAKRMEEKVAQRSTLPSPVSPTGKKGRRAFVPQSFVFKHITHSVRGGQMSLRLHVNSALPPPEELSFASYKDEVKDDLVQDHKKLIRELDAYQLQQEKEAEVAEVKATEQTEPLRFLRLGSGVESEGEIEGEVEEINDERDKYERHRARIEKQLGKLRHISGKTPRKNGTMSPGSEMSPKSQKKRRVFTFSAMVATPKERAKTKR